jgi:hypothetical protein
MRWSVTVPIVACVAGAFLSGCGAKQKDERVSLKPPTTRVGAFEYDRPYDSKQMIELADQTCQEIAAQEGHPNGFTSPNLDTDRSGRYWLFCELFAQESDKDPVLTYWLYQDRWNGKLVWRRFNPSAGSGSPPPR